jgi:hypothetical protein
VPKTPPNNPDIIYVRDEDYLATIIYRNTNHHTNEGCTFDCQFREDDTKTTIHNLISNSRAKTFPFLYNYYDLTAESPTQDHTNNTTQATSKQRDLLGSMKAGLKNKPRDQQLITLEYWIAILTAIYTLYDIRAEPTTLLKYFINNVQQGFYLTSRLVYHHTRTFVTTLFPQDFRTESHLWEDMMQPKELYASLEEEGENFKNRFDDYYELLTPYDNTTITGRYPFGKTEEEDNNMILQMIHRYYLIINWHLENEKKQPRITVNHFFDNLIDDHKSLAVWFHLWTQIVHCSGAIKYYNDADPTPQPLDAYTLRNATLCQDANGEGIQS